MATLAEYGLRPFDHPVDRSHPPVWRAATLTAEKRAHICEDSVGHGSQPKRDDGVIDAEPVDVDERKAA